MNPTGSVFNISGKTNVTRQSLMGLMHALNQIALLDHIKSFHVITLFSVHVRNPILCVTCKVSNMTEELY